MGQRLFSDISWLIVKQLELINACAHGNVNLDSSDTAMTNRFCHVELNFISRNRKICILKRHVRYRGLTQGGLRTAATHNRNLKNTYFVNTIISNAVRDLPFSRNQQLK